MVVQRLKHGKPLYWTSRHHTFRHNSLLFSYHSHLYFNDTFPHRAVLFAVGCFLLAAFVVSLKSNAIAAASAQSRSQGNPTAHNSGRQHFDPHRHH
jgi:hypothetical protein